uniref:Uncharacterized protein n=1 Tax=Anguilla anguilla TaxID=7936 RepID=A0A0E9W3W5_ANGAN
MFTHSLNTAHAVKFSFQRRFMPYHTPSQMECHCYSNSQKR